jgi:Uma2 family endonuclease
MYPGEMLVGPSQTMNDDEFWAFCAEDRKRRIERDANGEVVMIQLAGAETAYRSAGLTAQLGNWSKEDGRGRSFGFNTGYLLPNGAARSPYASWVLRSRIDPLAMEEKRRFPPLCPDFVVELTSPSDLLPRLKAKMREWMENGASLGWLIDADNRTVYIYRPGQEPEELANVDHVAGEGPVEGFRLELADIWQGL